jgi:hypothetical protein
MLGDSLASKLKGTTFEHDDGSEFLQMSALEPIRPYTAISKCLQDLKRDGKINPQGEIIANASAISGKGGAPCKYVFFQDDKGIISILDKGHGWADPNRRFASMNVTQDGNTIDSVDVQPGRLEVNLQDEFVHASTNGLEMRGPPSSRPSSPLHQNFGRDGYSRPTSPVNESFGSAGISRPPSPASQSPRGKRYSDQGGDDSDY